MADAAKQGSAQETDGPQPPPARPDPAVSGDEAPTGGLTAVLGKLRDAAAAHDAELADPDGPAQLS